MMISTFPIVAALVLAVVVAGIIMVSRPRAGAVIDQPDDVSPLGGDGRTVGVRQPMLLLVAVVLLVGVIGAAVVFGVQAPPAVPSLADVPEPAPSGGIAWIAPRGGTETCIEVLRPDAGRDRIACGEHDREILAWDDEGIVTYAWNDHVLVVHDPQTGAVVRRDDETHDEWTAPEQIFLDVGRSDGAMVVSDMDRHVELWRVAAPGAYDIYTGVPSPDGRWVAMQDNIDRLVVVRSDGSGEARTWAEDVDAWSGLVWEGTEPTPYDDLSEE